jgi:predicted AlkP superfamily pyrophosphatase or phosphodiesterase
MKSRARFHVLLAWLAILITAPSLAAQTVLMISIDGLKPEYVTQADTYGVHSPNLRAFVANGTYAEGVTGVLPTVTYPSHTTLVTGAWPAEHGVLNNTLFDPLRKDNGAWYWFADAVKVPTLWQAAHDAHLSTASVSWPATIDAPGIDTNIPEFWGLYGNAANNSMLEAFARPLGVLNEIEARLGPYTQGTDVFADDEVRTKFAIDIIAKRKPRFMTVHLLALDEVEHETGPFSPEAIKTIDALDGLVGQLMAAEIANDLNTTTFIVSDHGFAAVDKSVNLTIPFVQAGLVTLAPQEPNHAATVASWQAMPWGASGTAAILLNDAKNKKVRGDAENILKKLAADPANGILKILDNAQARAIGGFPDAAFVVAFKPGFKFGGNLTGNLITLSDQKGTHGYLPELPEMRASFFALGQDVASGRNLGVIDMRQIAPTVAATLKFKLPSATQPALHLSQ